MATVKRTSSRPVTTKGGHEVDADYGQRLAAEAEAGFDPAALERRPAGRPSLSGRAGSAATSKPTDPRH